MDMHMDLDYLETSKTKTRSKSLDTQLTHRRWSGKICFCTFVYL